MTTHYLIKAACGNGHTQELKVDKALGLRYAYGLAGLLDGTSEMYLHKPGQESPIGKCGLCQSQITCVVIRPDGGVT